MRQFKDFDSTALKAFYNAALTENFTEAARASNLTQSGISQHIAKLEATLKTTLFLRVGRRVQLTEPGERFLAFVETLLDSFENTLEDISGQTENLAGLVSYAMPASCRFTPHFSILLEKIQAQKNIKLRVHFGPTEEVESAILENEVDFGFVTKNTRHPEIAFEEFAIEEYALIGHPRFNLKKVEAEALRSTPFIRYPGVDVLLAAWSRTHLSRARQLNLAALNIVAEVNSLNGAIMMVNSGLGVSVFAKHCLAESLSKKSVVEYKGPASTAATNPIWVAYLKNKKQSKRVDFVLDIFREMKK